MPSGKMGKKHPVKNLENDQMDINRLMTAKTVVSSIFWPWHMWDTTHVRYEPLGQGCHGNSQGQGCGR
jgi:hypothetical protein